MRKKAPPCFPPARAPASRPFVSAMAHRRRRRSSMRPLNPRLRLLVLTAAVVGAFVAVDVASAAQLIDRNAAGVVLAANTKGEALLTCRSHGGLKHVLVWGAVNAKTPNKSVKQVSFHKDYAGGYGRYHQPHWKSFADSCSADDGPDLPSLLAAWN